MGIKQRVERLEKAFDEHEKRIRKGDAEFRKLRAEIQKTKQKQH